MINGLETILEKEEVISTISADHILNEPQNVEVYYQYHAKTFIPMGKVKSYLDRLIKLIKENKAPKGYVVADYGYGKTSTLIYFWSESERTGLLAVPPFQCSTLYDILKAIYGWTKFKLSQTYPSLIKETEDIYTKYFIANIEQAAKRYAENLGISTSAARKMLEDLMRQGKPVVDVTPINLVRFLEDIVKLVKRAGFYGLVIFLDEFQQYISKSSNLSQRIQELRELIWELSSIELPLGLVIGMPSYTESAIVDRGEDIIHRLKNDKLCYQLKEIYTRKFPKELWEKYAEIFELGNLASEIIDEYALESIGQISERDDLGEGPRTVVEAFKRAIHYHQTTGQIYNPIAFIEDIISGRIVFLSHTNKIKNVVNKHLHSAVIDTDEKRKAIMLLAAFPRGCRPEIQRAYGLYDIINELSKVGHGDLMIHVAEGYTLLGLQEGKGPEDIIDKIVYDFWRKYEEGDAIYWACSAFVKKLIPLLFEKKKGTALVGWKILRNLPETWGYRLEMEGTFNPHYPSRYLRIRVIRHDADIDFDDKFDFQFDFILKLRDRFDCGWIEKISDRYMRFHLNMKHKPEITLPDDLKKLQDYVNPELVTPLLMLSLVEYFEEWDKKYHIPEGNKSEVEFLISRLLNHTIQWLFNEELAKSFGISRVGKWCIEDMFNILCRNVYPDYCTFVVSSKYGEPLMDYHNALLNLTLKQRRGHAELKGSKEDIAALFGVTSIATFENRLRNDYKELVEVKTWEGKGKTGRCVIILKLHPLEQVILDHLRNRDDKFLSLEELLKIARSLGYLDKEVEWAISLLKARLYIDVDNPDNPSAIYLIQAGPTRDEVAVLINDIENKILKVASIIDKSTIELLENNVSRLKESVDTVSDEEEELDELFKSVKELENQLKDIMGKERENLRQKLNIIILELNRHSSSLRQNGPLDREILGQVGFVQHLNDARLRLIKIRDNIKKDIDILEGNSEELMKKTFPDPIEGALELYRAVELGEKELESVRDKVKDFEEKLSSLNKWKSLLQRADRLFNDLRYTPDLKDKFNEVVCEIQEHFVKNKIDGLKDYEIFEGKINEIEKELNEIRRISYEQFANVKEDYQKLLRSIGIGDHLRSRFTYGEDEESYKDLYAEIKEKVENRLNELNKFVEEIKVDLLKAEHIYALQDISKFSNKVMDIRGNIDNLRKALNLELIKDFESFRDYLENVKQLIDDIDHIKIEIGRIIRTVEYSLNAEELNVLKLFERKEEIDVTDIFVQLRLGGKDIDLQYLMDILIGLYRKNRVIIRVRKRS